MDWTQFSEKRSVFLLPWNWDLESPCWRYAPNWSSQTVVCVKQDIGTTFLELHVSGTKERPASHLPHDNKLKCINHPHFCWNVDSWHFGVLQKAHMSFAFYIVYSLEAWFLFHSAIFPLPWQSVPKYPMLRSESTTSEASQTFIGCFPFSLFDTNDKETRSRQHLIRWELFFLVSRSEGLFIYTYNFEGSISMLSDSSIFIKPTTVKTNERNSLGDYGQLGNYSTCVQR